MSDLYVINFGGDDEERSRRDQERRDADATLWARYARHLVETVDMGEVEADLVISALFDHTYPDGRECHCGCHPQLSTDHDDGFDCRCTWDDARRAEATAEWQAALSGPMSSELREQTARESAAIAQWMAGQPGVDAERTSSAAPEQWKGMIDGHSFYFRERHGNWRIELDLAPNGHFANRFVTWGDDGEMVTEPVAMEDGTVIAEGVDTQLGESAVDHIAFIVQTIRDHLFAGQCRHEGSLFFCPACGKRMDGPR
jgi:hypothetical protein